ncbi:MAG: polyprenyl diphosphate synthase [bacterium]
MKHLAIIPDGNRRWAKKTEQKNADYFFGAQSCHLAVKFCLKQKISYLSFYVFSLENFNRDKNFENHVLRVVIDYIKNYLNEFISIGLRIKFIGNKDYFSENDLQEIQMIEQKTSNQDRLTVNILFYYGGQQEILSAVKSLGKKIQSGAIKVDDINEQIFKQHLWLADSPDPDLIIRTGGQTRLSNFLLYQTAYSEFISLDCFWPVITEKHLLKCLKKFECIQRNFGK